MSSNGGSANCSSLAARQLIEQCNSASFRSAHGSGSAISSCNTDEKAPVDRFVLHQTNRADQRAIDRSYIRPGA
jgi:hypothetical protein